MTYRDDRDALKARIESLEQEIERTKATSEEDVLFPRKTPQQRRRQALMVGSAVLAAAGLAAGAWQWSARVAQAETRGAWSRLSSCLVGDPLAPGETARARARRIQLATVSQPRSAEARWPGRCQSSAHQLYESLREHGQKGAAASRAEDMAAKIEHGTADEEILAMLDPLFRAAAEAGLVASPTSEGPPAPAPASPLRLADLAGAAVTTAEVPTTSIYTEMVPGEDRHAIVDDPRAGAPVLCTLPASGEGFSCRPLPGALAGQHGLRLLGTTDPGAAPLVFAGHDGEGGIYRADTGEQVASVAGALRVLGQGRLRRHPDLAEPDRRHLRRDRAARSGRRGEADDGEGRRPEVRAEDHHHPPDPRPLGQAPHPDDRRGQPRHLSLGRRKVPRGGRTSGAPSTASPI